VERPGVDGGAAHEEEAAHRVAHAVEPAGEGPAGEAGEAPGDDVPGGAEAVAAAAAHLAGGADDVGAGGLAGVIELAEDFGGMLELGVHHSQPLPAGPPDALDDGARDPADPLPRLPVDDGD